MLGGVLRDHSVALRRPDKLCLKRQHLARLEAAGVHRIIAAEKLVRAR